MKMSRLLNPGQSRGLPTRLLGLTIWIACLLGLMIWLPLIRAEAPPAGPLTTRERAMLEELQDLKRRLASLESKLTGLSPQQDAQPEVNAAKVTLGGLGGGTSQQASPYFSKYHPLLATYSTRPGPAPLPPLGEAAPADWAPRADGSPTPAVPAKGKSEPFAFADFTWLTGNPRTKESPIDTKWFTAEFRIDANYTHDLNHPRDNTIGGSSEIFRSGEVQLTQVGIGGDFHWENVRGRLMTQFGLYSQTTPRNDASPARGQWNLDNAYRYLSEAYGGYHFDKLHGINVDAGIFMSYIGLFSYYQFDNWAYQPSYVSSNTPWFFNGVRVQIHPTDKLKIEPWFINGWQSYGKFNKAPGIGAQILWRPNGTVSIVSNNYWGTDTLGIPDRKRVHTDNSIQLKYYENQSRFLSKSAATLTIDAGCEYGEKSGVSCRGGNALKPSQYFLGFMAYQRFWFHKDKFATTLGGGAITNPGRYLVLVPPINGATAFTGTPYFSASPGDPYKAWDASATFDYMPRQYLTWRFEYNHRAANVPYFSGAGGITPPGGNTGSLGSFVPDWSPDLRKRENRFTIALLIKL